MIWKTTMNSTKTAILAIASLIVQTQIKIEMHKIKMKSLELRSKIKMENLLILNLKEEERKMTWSEKIVKGIAILLNMSTIKS